jgi:polysaccharide export outer membrane protein
MTVRQAIALAGGFDTMRFRSRDPFLEAADFRGDYYSLWTEFARQQVRIARLKAELADKTQIDREGFTEVPIPTSVVAQIEELEARELTSRNDDYAKEKAHLLQTLKDQDRRVAVLADNTDKERQGAQADANDFLELQEKFKRGVIPMLRMSDARRFTLFSASQSLQTAAQLAQAQRERGDMARSLERLEGQRRIDLLKELQDAEVTIENTRARLQAVADKLLYAGMVKSQLVRGAGGKPDVRVFRNVDNQRQTLNPDENSPLMPGDVVEVALRLEDLAGSPRSDQASKDGH